MASYSVQKIADRVGGQVLGDGSIQITGMESIDRAQPGQLSFMRDARFADQWASSKASAALIGPEVELEPGDGRALVRVRDADVAVARVLELFAPPQPQPNRDRHATATIHASASIGRDVLIGPNCYIGPGARLGDGCVLHAGVVVMDESTLGEGCVLWPNVVVRERCSLGRRCIVHPNATIGADGFGYRPNPDGGGLIKIPQIGTVEIGDDVEIGANTCVDRGKFSATVIGEGTKIDNLCQIAHNVRIGRWCVMAGQSGMAGSAEAGDGVMIGGGSIIRDGVKLGAGARVAAGSGVAQDMPAGAYWGGTPAQDMRQTLREVAASRRLPDLVKTVFGKQKPER